MKTKSISSILGLLLFLLFSTTTIAGTQWSEPAGTPIIGTPNWGYTLAPLYDEPLSTTPQTWTELDEVGVNPESFMGVIFTTPQKVSGVRFYSYANADMWNHISSYKVLGKVHGAIGWTEVVPEKNSTGALPGWEETLFTENTFDGIKVVYTGVSYPYAPRVGELQFNIPLGEWTKCGKTSSVNIPLVSNIYNSSVIYKVQNNIWNDTAKSQCIRGNNVGDFNVSKSIHNKLTNEPPASYPFIYKGCHWGVCTNRTKSGMPIQVSKIFNASSSWETAQPATGIYNVAYDIWFNQTPTTSTQPNGAELMIWLAYLGNVQPVGSLIASNVSIAGTTWDVWQGLNGTYNTISYVRTAGTTSVSNLNLKAFVSDATNRHYIQPAWYLISVEAGFEIWQGGKDLASSSFSVLVE